MLPCVNTSLNPCSNPVIVILDVTVFLQMKVSTPRDFLLVTELISDRTLAHTQVLYLWSFHSVTPTFPDTLFLFFLSTLLFPRPLPASLPSGS